MTMTRTKIAASWLACVLLALSACSNDSGAEGISTANPRIRLLPGDLPLAGYVELHNKRSEPVELVSASSAAFTKVQIHETVEQEGTAKMMPVASIAIEPSGTAELRPGGRHLMLMGRKRDLVLGDTVTIRLHFADADPVDVQFTVEPADVQ